MSDRMYLRKQLIAIVVLLFSLLSAGCNTESDTARDTSAPAAENQPRDSVVIVLAAADSTTVFDLLTSAHQVDYQASAMGVFVRGIDSVYGTSSAFWVYSVNDSLPKVAADKYTVHAGDTVRWHLRKSGE